MKTIAQQLNIKTFPFIIRDDKGKQIYCETDDGLYVKLEYHINGGLSFKQTWNGDIWTKREYNKNGKIIYYEYSEGYWWKREYDENGIEVYYENSNGYIRDNKPKILELTLEDIAKQYNIDVNLIKIKK